MAVVAKKDGKWQVAEEKKDREPRERFAIAKDTNFQDAYNEVIAGNSFMRKKTNI